MQNLITKHTTPYPPAAIGPLNSPDGAHLFAGPAVIRDSAGRAVPPFHTHGYTLAAEPDLDRGLMHLLLRCLADLPEDRPSLWELQWLMGTMEGAPDWAIGQDDPEGVRAWCDRMFGSPPAVSSEFPFALFVDVVMCCIALVHFCGCYSTRLRR